MRYVKSHTNMENQAVFARFSTGYSVQSRNAVNQNRQKTEDDLDQVTTPLFDTETEENGTEEEDDNLVKLEGKSKSRKKKKKK